MYDGMTVSGTPARPHREWLKAKEWDAWTKVKTDQRQGVPVPAPHLKGTQYHSASTQWDSERGGAARGPIVGRVQCQMLDRECAALQLRIRR